METTGNDELTRWLIAAARVIHRFSRRGAVAGLAVGALAFAALVPWLPGSGAGALPAGIVLAAALVVAPLRVMWHGWAISQAYGDPDRIEAALAAVPGSLDEVADELRAVARPAGASTGRGGGRRVVAAWRTLRALRDALQNVQDARDEVEYLVRPLRPEAVGLTVTALWATLATLSFGVPVALVSAVALAVT